MSTQNPFVGRPGQPQVGGPAGGVTFKGGGTLPTIASITPARSPRGRTAAVTVTGTGFAAGSPALIFGEPSGSSPVTVANLTVVDDNEMTADVTVPADAFFAVRDVHVSTAAGLSASGVPFTVFNLAAYIRAANPAVLSYA